MKCVVKERFKKEYRVKELDEKLTKQRILQVWREYEWVMSTSIRNLRT